jgi:hypothetical protein
MRKIMFIFFLSYQLTAIAQTEPDVQPVKSKIENLLTENSTLLESTTEEIGTISNSFTIKVVKLKNLNTGAKISGLVFESNSFNNNFIGVIDADEMDFLMKALSTMKEAANSTRPLRTELRFRSRTGFEISALFDYERKEYFNDTKPGERNWTYVIKSYSKGTRSPLRAADFMALCGFVEAAKSKL